MALQRDKWVDEGLELLSSGPYICSPFDAMADQAL